MAWRNSYLLFVLAGHVPTTGAAATLHVPADFPTIQAGIAAASFGDTVEIACGTYFEHDVALKAGVAVRGASATADCVIVDALGLGRVLVGIDLGASASISGLTLTHGFTDGVHPANTGGGLFLSESSPTISNCRFLENSTGVGSVRSGGGGAIGCLYSSPVVVECEFVENVLPDHAHGGAVLLNPGSATILRCTFTSNEADLGGAVSSLRGPSLLLEDCVFTSNTAGVGGAVVMSLADARVTRCSFTSNTARFGTGGALYGGGATATIEDCRFVGNVAGNPGGGDAGGGAIRWGTGSAEIRSTTFESNRAVASGGAVSANGSAQLILTDCRFVRNEASGGGALHARGGAAFAIVRCLALENRAAFGSFLMTLESCSSLVRSCTVFGNALGSGVISVYGATSVENSIVALNESSPVVHCGPAGAIDVTCSDFWLNSGGDWPGCIEGESHGDGNFSADPLFCDLHGRWLAIGDDSPCAPGHSPAGCGLIGALPPACGTIPLATESWGRMKALFR